MLLCIVRMIGYVSRSINRKIIRRELSPKNLMGSIGGEAPVKLPDHRLQSGPVLERLGLWRIKIVFVFGLQYQS